VEQPSGSALVDAGRGRRLAVRCEGHGSPTVVLEAGDGDTSSAWDAVVVDVARHTTTCVYDRAGLGASDPAPRGARQLDDLLEDLDTVLDRPVSPPPYLLVGASGGGYLVHGFAASHPDEVAGLVLVDTSPPYVDPPPQVVAETRPDAPGNLEHRDYLQVEKDSWARRTSLGDVPLVVMSNAYTRAEIRSAPTATERRDLAGNVARQRGWLRISTASRQVVTHTGHDVTGADPALVAGTVLDVLARARAAAS
jgi:pimeloyl-ACP methyl ester carboxylesterase